MKLNIIISITFLAIGSVFCKAQVSIGIPASAEGGILDFGPDNNKGILLPRIITLDPGTVPGTLYYDTSDSKVKFMGSTEVDLSVKGVAAGNEFDVTANGYNALVETVDVQGVIIGDEAAAAGIPGVLILEAQDKALILPKVTSFANVGDPEAGTIVYDTSTKLFCVYDGEKWAFWGKK